MCKSILDISNGYSRTTLKAYAKFRLLSVDRRFALSTKYIFTLFDWVQKDAVFGYHNRMAPRRVGSRSTVASDVYHTDPTKDSRRAIYNQTRTVAVPPTIRTGIKYKQDLYLKFSALFDFHGDPQLFGTYTCDDNCPGLNNVFKEHHDDETPFHKDPVLFLMHWKEKWSRFFGFVRGDWAKKYTGKIVAYCWVLEIQDRGAPHAHFCLWTEKSIDEMIKENVITCSSIGSTPESTRLIQKHQVHHCSSYCQNEGYENAKVCRFSFPKKPSLNATYFDTLKNRYIYNRTKDDSFINCYNIDLLLKAKANIDIQLNHGSLAIRYICKYITESAAIFEASMSQDRMNGSFSGDLYTQNFNYRSVSVTEAIMDLCSWSMSGCSHLVIFLPSELPNNRKGLLKPLKDLQKLEPESADIFMDDKWKKYLDRPTAMNDKSKYATYLSTWLHVLAMSC